MVFKLLNDKCFLCSSFLNTSSSSNTSNTFFTSFMKDGGLCLSDSAFTLFSCLKVVQMSCSTPIDLATRLTTLQGYMDSLTLHALERKLHIPPFNCLFKYSKCKSHEIFPPVLPLVLINHDHFSCAALRGDSRK